MILGLDISTSITGATILNKKGEVLLNTSFDLRNKKHFPSLYEKANHVSEMLDMYYIKHFFEHIYIEESLQAFRPGFSSAKTLMTLAKFNGIVSYICKRQFGIEPQYIPAISARKTCGIKIPRGTKAKEVVLQHVLDNEDNFLIEYTKHGNPKPETYDRADSLIIARAGHILWKEKN
tara:strand:+ start:41 stop:571 length:531 start_codon:yes stop_codon:yes gene_type:complete